ncbi:hypothetical protein ACI8AC_08375 [Geodermatophilus sp. SYSU D00758]
MRLLLVCTGNLCRSPLAERLATAWAADALAGSPEAAEVSVVSAGLDAVEDRDMDPEAAAALTALGGDPAGFRSRALTAELAAEADLVLTMTRDQRRSVLEVNPRGLRRTFTLLEATDLLNRADLGGVFLSPVRTRAVDLALRLDAARADRTSGSGDDIADPIGRRPEVHTTTARTIEVALRPLADVLFTSVRTHLPALVPA